MNAEHHTADLDREAVSAFMAALRGRGVSFRPDDSGSKILYAPVELVTPEDLETLRQAKPIALALLREEGERATAPGSPVVLLRRPRPGWTPGDPFCIVPSCPKRGEPMTPTLRPGCFICRGCFASAVTISSAVRVRR